MFAEQNLEVRSGSLLQSGWSTGLKRNQLFNPTSHKVVCVHGCGSEPDETPGDYSSRRSRSSSPLPTRHAANVFHFERPLTTEITFLNLNNNNNNVKTLLNSAHLVKSYSCAPNIMFVCVCSASPASCLFEMCPEHPSNLRNIYNKYSFTTRWRPSSLQQPNYNKLRHKFPEPNEKQAQ